MAEITYPLNTPFITGSGSEPQADSANLPVSVNGRGFLIDNFSGDGMMYQRFMRQSIQLLNTQQAQSSADQSLIAPEVWRRSIESWASGAGQPKYDKRESLPERYESSSGMDPWTRWTLRPLNRTTLARTLPAGRCKVSQGNGVTLFCVGTQGYWFDGATYASITFTSAVIDATSDGNFHYTLHTNKEIRKWTDSITSVVFATAPATPVIDKSMLAVVKGFLMLGLANVLYDATSGTPAVVMTHPLASFVWLRACDGLTVAYFLGGSGDKWHILRSAVDATTATKLTPPAVAATLPDGEVALEVASYQGFVLVGTSKGWRFANPAGDGALTYGRLIHTQVPVRCFEGQDRFVWFGMDGQVSPARAPLLGRADLSTFVGDLVPAAADDLQGGTSGAVAYVGTAPNGLRLYAVEGEGVYAEQAIPIASATLTQGAIDFGANDSKKGLYAQVFNEPIAGGTYSVEAFYDGSLTADSIGAGTSFGSVSSGNMGLREKFTSVSLRITIAPDATSNLYPIINRVEVRSVPIPGSANEWRIPLVVKDTIEYDGATYSRSAEEDFDMLLGLVNSRATFAYREGSRQYQLFATEYAWMPQHLTESMTSFEGTFVLTAREVL
jgi:hypothetical protein